jgi:hypothetical protein
MIPHQKFAIDLLIETQLDTGNWKQLIIKVGMD